LGKKQRRKKGGLEKGGGSHHDGGGGGGKGTPIYKPYQIWVYATVKGMVFKQFGLGYGTQLRGICSSIGYHLSGNLNEKELTVQLEKHAFIRLISWSE